MKTASDIVTRMIQPAGAAPCAGCGEMVETATVLGRTVYACDDCARWERRTKPRKNGKEEG